MTTQPNLTCAMCERRFRERRGQTIHITLELQVDIRRGAAQRIEERIDFCSEACHDRALRRGKTANGAFFACLHV